ncbi:hypothetical protein WJX72_000686 [[Myrmecia] bisecta]|uniref:EF-hand domain-containing protein n=1 Tax=[Myrmecia] bisecta TaxID=41462 RepID=A0AAW1QQ28_9CHLO
MTDEQEEVLNDYEKDRQARIARNKAMLVRLKVQHMAENIAAPLAEAEAQEQLPTRAKLQKLVGKDSDDSDSEGSMEDRSEDGVGSDSERVGRANLRKRRREARDFDPADEREADGSGEDGDEAESASSEGEMDVDGAPGGEAEAAQQDKLPAVPARARRRKGQPSRREDAAGIADEQAALAAAMDIDPDDFALQQALALSMAEHAGAGKNPVSEARSSPPAAAKSSAATQAPSAAPSQPTTAAAATALGGTAGGDAAPEGSSSKPAGKAGKAGGKGRGRRKQAASVEPPSKDEIQQAFCMFDPYGQHRVTKEGIQQVCHDLKGELDDRELEAMMTYAADVCGCSASDIDFQAFNVLVERFMGACKEG